ncbi:hypothetical protein ILUMI_14118 [Ignelater luminosus]|uniref:Uncharacterized protein n=1 Tax=Ignelater luminosus TaxID=2038154 RepID=A0A8K0CR31_IGNLU|nr:hypothetical protein ILUMI_14118 [Ignelater luminosus]
MCYGLDSTGLRILSFQYAKELKFIIPLTWEKEKKATEDWLRGFKQRYRAVLSLRKPEKTNLSRATAFNPTTVNNFFDNLEKVMGKYNFTAKKGLKQVGQATSAGRGELVTVLNFVNASRSFLAPVFIFPRVRFKQFMLTGARSGSLGTCI